ncbi:MAG: hypothetical protein EZS28_004388 [Streblomastix strix]|uniref:Uncharacterized protein n=1 Tax=Streblomastix strix TaxID=222440 RepID=A0A5J4WYL9_9EUKA|nr:MAG: hypothetical protein EZS28_004388 [Streblomastix strix]
MSSVGENFQENPLRNKSADLAKEFAEVNCAYISVVTMHDLIGSKSNKKQIIFREESLRFFIINDDPNSGYLVAPTKHK